MFSVRQKREIAEALQTILRATNHPELPKAGEIRFKLRVEGAEEWSWAEIVNNGAVARPGVNSWNEMQDTANAKAQRPEGYADAYCSADPVCCMCGRSDGVVETTAAGTNIHRRCLEDAALGKLAGELLPNSVLDR